VGSKHPVTRRGDQAALIKGFLVARRLPYRVEGRKIVFMISAVMALAIGECAVGRANYRVLGSCATVQSQVTLFARKAQVVTCG
jgi:hypothetical protein